ncbi:response regulator [Roseiterribacter gracilis]|uniref:Response regulatory domain-containing protein n=1 Tax=Roseiterribacter gracilis TaxID=2812848 RepID=A0A8S8X9Z9_9PROT|nr:hypothetical protein TMPK1_11390 [Rhodospirillales bacterium TMPK1]
MRVLILEHDPLCAFDFIAALEAHGHEVIGPAARVSVGARLLRRRRVDLALIDLRLGLDRGLDLIPHAESAGVRCIAITGSPLEAKAASDRLVGCMPKPVSGEQVAALVNWYEDACAGSNKAPPSTFMSFGASPPQVRAQSRACTMPRRLRSSFGR